MKLLIIFICLICIVAVSDALSQSATKYYITRYDQYNRYIYIRNIDGTNETNFTLSIRPKAIAVDWYSSPKKLYIGLVPTSGTCTIIRCNLDGSNQENVLTDLVNVNDIELDLINRKIYWLQNTYNDDKIYKADMDALNSNIEYIYYTTVTSRDLWGLALDVTNNLLWITERGSNSYASYIRRMTTSGGSITTIKNPIDNPHDIEYHNAKIYWGEDTGIMQSNTDGSSTNTLYSNADADGLAIDATNNAVLWVDYSTNEVKKIDFDGSNYAVHSPVHSTISNLDTDYNPGALPVELSSFNGRATSQGIALQWSTRVECNNYGFDIERKGINNNSEWEKIGFVAGAGNSNSPKEYSFSDNVKHPCDHSILYRLKQIDNDGMFTYSNVIEVRSLTYNFSLSQNYPNPFNPVTVINYQLPAESRVTLKLFDVLGREVATLVDEVKAPGMHSAEFIVEKYGLSSGIYIYQLSAGEKIEKRKMMVIK